MTWLKDILTEGGSYCPVRVIGASGALVYFGLAIGSFVVNHAFDPTGFGAGLAAICGSVGLGVGLKKKLGS